MMKLYKYLILLSLSLFITVSCDLDREPYGDGSFWTTAEEVKMGLDAAYEPLYFENGYGRGYLWTDLSDDMIYNRSRSGEDPIARFTSDANNSGGIKNHFDYFYMVIRRCNDVMEHAPKIEMSDADRYKYLGEANYLCAFSYFALAKRYGGLAFYDWKEPTNLFKERETKAETYRRIEEYIKEAIKNFEAGDTPLWVRSDADWGRPNLGAMYGLLAKVYLHWGKYAEAKAAAEKVIGKYSLNTTNNNGYKHLFSSAGEKHEEVLFNLTCLPVRNFSTITGILGISGTMSGGVGWYYFAPTQSLANSFESGDLRREVTLKGVGDKVNWLPYYNKRKKEDPTVTLPVEILAKDIADMKTGYMMTKYSANYDQIEGWEWYTGKDIPLLRYADVLLVHAEAEIMLGGGGPDNRAKGVAAAAKSFNEVRLRAFGGDVSKAIAAPTFNDLVKERRCELAYEDERHFDLVRWGMAKEIYTKNYNANVTSDPAVEREARNFIPEKHNHIPFPQSHIDDSRGMLKNNPLNGYSTFE